MDADPNLFVECIYYRSYEWDYFYYYYYYLLFYYYYFNRVVREWILIEIFMISAGAGSVIALTQ